MFRNQATLKTVAVHICRSEEGKKSDTTLSLVQSVTYPNLGKLIVDSLMSALRAYPQGANKDQ
eukprot:546529-Amorphochlora_amoeboformis.AAC.1